MNTLRPSIIFSVAILFSGVLFIFASPLLSSIVLPVSSAPVFWGLISGFALLDATLFVVPLSVASFIVSMRSGLHCALRSCLLFGVVAVALNYYLIQETTIEVTTIWMSTYRIVVIAVLFIGPLLTAVLSHQISRTARCS